MKKQEARGGRGSRGGRGRGRSRGQPRKPRVTKEESSEGDEEDGDAPEQDEDEEDEEESSGEDDEDEEDDDEEEGGGEEDVGAHDAPDESAPAGQAVGDEAESGGEEGEEPAGFNMDAYLASMDFSGKASTAGGSVMGDKEGLAQRLKSLDSLTSEAESPGELLGAGAVLESSAPLPRKSRQSSAVMAVLGIRSRSRSPHAKRHPSSESSKTSYVGRVQRGSRRASSPAVSTSPALSPTAVRDEATPGESGGGDCSDGPSPMLPPSTAGLKKRILHKKPILLLRRHASAGSRGSGGQGRGRSRGRGAGGRGSARREQGTGRSPTPDRKAVGSDCKCIMCGCTPLDADWYQQEIKKGETDPQPYRFLCAPCPRDWAKLYPKGDFEKENIADKLEKDEVCRLQTRCEIFCLRGLRDPDFPNSRLSDNTRIGVRLEEHYAWYEQGDGFKDEFQEDLHKVKKEVAPISVIGNDLDMRTGAYCSHPRIPTHRLIKYADTFYNLDQSIFEKAGRSRQGHESMEYLRAQQLLSQPNWIRKPLSHDKIKEVCKERRKLPADSTSAARILDGNQSEDEDDIKIATLTQNRPFALPGTLQNQLEKKQRGRAKQGDVAASSSRGVSAPPTTASSRLSTSSRHSEGKRPGVSLGKSGSMGVDDKGPYFSFMGERVHTAFNAYGTVKEKGSGSTSLTREERAGSSTSAAGASTSGAGTAPPTALVKKEKKELTIAEVWEKDVPYYNVLADLISKPGHLKRSAKRDLDKIPAGEKGASDDLKSFIVTLDVCINFTAVKITKIPSRAYIQWGQFLDQKKVKFPPDCAIEIMKRGVSDKNAKSPFSDATWAYTMAMFFKEYTSAEKVKYLSRQSKGKPSEKLTLNVRAAAAGKLTEAELQLLGIEQPRFLFQLPRLAYSGASVDEAGTRYPGPATGGGRLNKKGSR